MILNKVAEYIKQYKMLEEGDNVVVGVSGGADSMCLLDILAKLRPIYGINIVVVHVHHGIRGAEADEDMKYVESECIKRNITFLGFKRDIPQMVKDTGLSSEEAGRQVRYSLFEETLAKYGTGKIAVAHNANDNVETILLNMCRGTGITGITGITPIRGNIIRPVRCLDRIEILRYLEEEGIAYRTDSTNLTDDYTRNKIRNKVIPYFTEEINARAVLHIQKLGDMATMLVDYVEKNAEIAYKDMLVDNDIDICKQGGVTMSLDAYEKTDDVLKPYVIRKALGKVAGKLKDITHKNISSVVDLANGYTGDKVDLPYQMEAIKYAESLVIRKKNEQDIEECVQEVIIDGSGTYRYGADMVCTVIYDVYDNVDFKEKTYTKWFGCDILVDKLILRTRRNGDYIVVNSDGGRKKINDLFTDLKIPKEKRDRIVLLANGNDILWVIGYRMSEAYKVSKDSKKIVKIQAMEEQE